MALASALSIRQSTAGQYRAPPDTPVFDAACDIVVTKTGPFEGELSPYMREPMNALGERKYHTVAMAGPGRCTKTLGLITCWAMRNIVHDPGDMLIVDSSQEKARKYSKFRLDPTIKLSKKVKAEMSPWSQDDNTYDKVTAKGMVLSIGWPSSTQLSGSDYRYVAMTEYDGMDEDVENEGSAYALGSKRTETFLSAGKVVVESSIRRTYRDPNWSPPEGFPHHAPPVTGVTGIYNSGTRKWFYWFCPGCGEPFALDPDVHVMFNLPSVRELLKILPDQDAKTWARSVAVIPCKGCGYAIQESERRDLNLGGVWVPDGCTVDRDGVISGTMIDSHIDSYQLSCVAAGYASWTMILYKYAQGIQSYVRTGEETSISETVNLDQGRAHLSLSVLQTRDVSTMADRCTGDWPQGTVPVGVRFLTAQIDVQAGKRAGFVVKITGWGVDLQQWPVDRFHLLTSDRKDPEGRALQLDPASYPEDWYRIVDKCIRRTYPLNDGSGRVMKVYFTVCDSGGAAGNQGEDEEKTSVTSNAYAFFRTLAPLRLRNKFRLIKGRGKGERWKESIVDADIPLINVNVNEIKEAIDGHLWRETIGPNYQHYPRWYAQDENGRARDWMDERTAEVRDGKGGWKQIGTRNEETDLDVYGQVAVGVLGADRIDWTKPPPWAADWEHNSEVIQGDGLPPPKPVAARPRPRLIQSKYMQR